MVLTFARKEIQNEVFSLVRKHCIESASDELEYNWLEQELSEWKTHGFLWHPASLVFYLKLISEIAVSLYLAPG